VNFSMTSNIFHAASSRRNILLIVAVALVLIMVFRAGVSWYLDYSQKIDSLIESKTLQFEKLTRLLAEATSYASEGDALNKLEREKLEKHFIKGPTPSLSEAAFQNLVKDMAQQNQIELKTMRILPTIKKDNLVLLQMSVSSRSEIGAISDFLLTVRNSEKFMYFSEVEIEATQYQESRFFNFTAKLTALTRE